MLARQAQPQHGPLHRTSATATRPASSNSEARETTAASWPTASVATVVSPPTGTRKASTTATRPASPVSKAGEITTTLWTVATVATVGPSLTVTAQPLSATTITVTAQPTATSTVTAPATQWGSSYTPQGSSTPWGRPWFPPQFVRGFPCPSQGQQPLLPWLQPLSSLQQLATLGLPQALQATIPFWPGSPFSASLFWVTHGVPAPRRGCTLATGPLSLRVFMAAGPTAASHPWHSRNPFCPRMIRSPGVRVGRGLRAGLWWATSWPAALVLRCLTGAARQIRLSCVGRRPSESQAPCLIAAELVLGAVAQPSTYPPSLRESAMVAAAVRRIQPCAASSHVLAWEALPASDWVVRVVRSGFRLPWCSAKAPLSTSSPAFRLPGNPLALGALDQDVSLLLSKGATEEVVSPSSPGFYRRIFVVPKASGRWRPVLDLSPLNAFLRNVPFRMETAASLWDAMHPGDWATSIHLKNVYFHLLIHPRDRKWLRFVWRDSIYQFLALPFGLAPASWIFTKVTGELCLHVRARGISLRVYLNDWLVLASSRELCSSHPQQVLHLCHSLGFSLNEEKSNLRPSQQFKFLGMTFNTLRWLVFPAPHRIHRLQSLLSSLSHRDRATARELALLLGQMESFVPLVPLGRLHKCKFQHYFRDLWCQARHPWDLHIPLGEWF